MDNLLFMKEALIVSHHQLLVAARHAKALAADDGRYDGLCAEIIDLRLRISDLRDRIQ